MNALGIRQKLSNPELDLQIETVEFENLAGVRKADFLTHSAASRRLTSGLDRHLWFCGSFRLIIRVGATATVVDF